MSHLTRLLHAKVRAVINRITRSPKWRHVEKAHLAGHGLCEGCGSTKHLQVHHRRPFHLAPELELDPENLVTCCMDLPECHLRISHGDNFKAWNPNVMKHLEMSRTDPESRPSIWLKAKADRLMVIG